MKQIRNILIFFLLLSNLSVAQYIPGKYIGTVDSRDFNDLNGKVSIQIYLSNTRVDSLELVEFDHDIYHKIHGPAAIKSKNTIPGEVITKQSIAVDGITGATISSNSILLGIARAVEKGFDGKLNDGIYTGTARGRKDAHHSGIIGIRLIIRNNKISNIEVDSVDQTTNHKRWGYYVEKAIKDIPNSVISSQSLKVDAISQATNTSNAILLAVARALEKALQK